MNGACKVLIVDDCEEDRAVYCRYLKSQNPSSEDYEIDSTESAETALALCETNAYDVVLLDYDLPELSGLEFLAWSQTQNLSSVAIIMLSAFGNESLAVQALKKGAQDYLVKQSLTPEILFHSIRSSLEQVRLKQKLQQSQERQQLISNIALRIRDSLNLSQVLDTTVLEIRKLLKCDRVLVFQSLASESQIVAESMTHTVQSASSSDSAQDCLLPHEEGEGKFLRVVDDVSDLLSSPSSALLIDWGVKSVLQAPILVDSKIGESATCWGYLVLHQGKDAVPWSLVDQEMLQELCIHLAIAIQQSELLTQTQCALLKEQELNLFKSKIVATVSHEYRTPITSILASASTLERHHDKLDSSQNRRLLNMISQQARHLRELVDDMLVVNQVELGQIQFRPFPLHLEQFFSRLIEEYDVVSQENHRMTLKIEGETEPFVGDFGLFKQIFGNLLSNAIKYSPEGGDILLLIQGDVEEVKITLRDPGIGIPSAELSHMFESFTRGSNVDTITGTGLGLSIAKACVDLHRGKIDIQSHVNEFTEVSVTFPRSC